MPEAIAASIVAAVGATGATAAAITVVVHVAYYAGLSYAAQAIASELAGGARAEDVQAAVDTPLGGRVVHFGKTKTGAHKIYDESVEGMRWQIYVTGQGGTGKIESFRFNETIFPWKQLAPNIYELGPYSRFGDAVRYSFFDGDVDQVAADLMFQPGRPLTFRSAPGWTAAHRLQGLSYFVIRSKTTTPENFQRVYPNGQPVVPAVVAEFLQPFDPRTGTRAFTDNGALIVAEYLIHEDGYGELTEDDIDWDSFGEAADHCDLLGLKLSGSWLLNRARNQPLQAMLAALDATLWETPEGKFALRIGAWQAPTVHLTDDHTLTVSDLTAGPSALNRTGQLKIAFTDRNSDFTEVETDPIGDPSSGAEQRIELPYCPTYEQAYLVGFRLFRRMNAEYRIRMDLNAAGLRLIGERFFTWTHPRLGFDQKVFELDSWAFNPTTMVVSIEAHTVEQNDFALDLDTLTINPAAGTNPNPNGTAPTPPTISDVPQPDVESVIYGIGGARIKLTSVEGNTSLTYEAEVLTEGAWQAVSVSSANEIFVPLGEGESTRLRVRSLTVTRRPSLWLYRNLEMSIGGGIGFPPDPGGRILT